MISRRDFTKGMIITLLFGCQEQELRKIEGTAKFKEEYIKRYDIDFLIPIVDPKKEKYIQTNLEIYNSLALSERINFSRTYYCWNVDTKLELKYNYTLFKPLFEEIAALYGCDWTILAKIALKESNMSPKKINRKSGARGLMQVMPFYFYNLDPLDPLHNILVGTGVYVTELKRTRNHIDALEAYNRGYSAFREQQKVGELNYRFAMNILHTNLDRIIE